VKMATYEYKLDTYNRMQRAAATIESDMNGRGQEGWEVVSASIEPNTIMVLFKRSLAKEPAKKATVAIEKGKFGKAVVGYKS
jgi:hypothetical protein